MENYADLMFQGPVADLQKAEGTFDKYQTAYKHRTATDLGENEINFIKAANSFYIATTTPDGWPYIQHRGGARGFVKITGPTSLACGDYRGNRQFISMGNLQTDDRVSLFFMDYLNHARLKIQGRAKLIAASDAAPDLLAHLHTPETPPERVLTIDVVSLDWNCPKYIPTLYSEDAIAQVIGPQIAQLRAENQHLREEVNRLNALAT